MKSLWKHQPKEASRTTNSVREIVNDDVLGPLTELEDKVRYLSVLVYRHTSYASIEAMATKDKHAILEHELKTPIKTLKSDNSREYVNNNISTYLKDKLICHETTAPHSPKQNGKAERFNRTIIEMTKKIPRPRR